MARKQSYTFIDLFAGIGGIRLAFQNAGGKCVFSSEWDAMAQQTYHANFGETPFAASVTSEKETKILEVDASKIFIDMAAAILDLFESDQSNIDRRESLTIRRVLDAANDPAALRGFITL